MNIKIVVVIAWFISVGALTLDWRIWRGNKRVTESQLKLFYALLPLSKRGTARFMAARVWINGAGLSVATGPGLLLFVFPEQMLEVAGERSSVLLPFVYLAFIGVGIAAFITFFGKPKWLIPRILRDKV
jgi:hypothetical protein